jgi:hypothetical protein
LAAGHVEGLDFGREFAEQDWLIDAVRHLTLGHFRDVLGKKKWREKGRRGEDRRGEEKG